MWEKSARLNPMSTRYRYYLDHRPMLPQDRTLGFLRPVDNPNWRFFLLFLIDGKLKSIFLNNIPVKDREDIRTLYMNYAWMTNNLSYFAYIPAVLLTGFFYRLGAGTPVFKYKIMYPIVFGFSLFLARKYLNTTIYSGYADNMSYYFHKYRHLAIERPNEVEDPMRKHFRVDTSVYYRETANDILHSGHHGDGGHEGQGGHHDTSTYYGPYPVILINYFF
jgi:hypothetical protein